MNNLTIDLDTLTDEAKAQIKAWVAEVNRPKEWPMEGDVYYFVCDIKDIEWSYWQGLKCDFCRRETGNCFRTKSEAIAYREHLKVCAELRRLADGDGKTRSHYSLAHVYDTQVYATELSVNVWSPYIFATLESAGGAIDTIGEKRLIDHYFNYGRKAN